MIKQHIYKNISTKIVHVILPSSDFRTAEELFIYPDTIKELEYPGLDQYVPHHLVKLEYGTGILINPNQVVPEIEPVSETIPEPVLEPVTEVESVPKVESIPEPVSQNVKVVEVVEKPKISRKKK